MSTDQRSDNERMQILEMIESGQITPSEGLALLYALEGQGPALAEELSENLPEENIPPLGFPEPGLEPTAIPELEQVQETIAGSEADAAWQVDETATQTQDVASQPGATSSDQTGESPAFRGQGAPAASGAAGGLEFSRWRRFWQIPLWIGVAITIVSGAAMFLAWQSQGFGILFACTWFPFLLGVGVMALAWSTRRLPWLHIRVQQKPGGRPERIAISLPLPLGLIGWGLRTFKHKIPNMGNVNPDEMIMALKHVTPEAPFSVDVDEGEDGEKVQIMIG